MKFTKMQGAGNDFIVINNINERLTMETFNGLARRLCKRRLSIGADGMMVVERPTQGGDFKMHFYNSDGSLGEMCGNGARCIAKYGYENKLAGNVMKIETMSGMVQAWRLDQMNYKVRLNDVTRMELNMCLDTKKGKYAVSYVELGNPGLPHLAVEMKDLQKKDPKDLWELGSELRHHPTLPKGANVNFYEILGPNEVFERTFERGVEDFTYACGTGTGSVAAVLATEGRVSGEHVKISMTGGDLFVDVLQNADGITDLYLSGPAVLVAEGEIGDPINI